MQWWQGAKQRPSTAPPGHLCAASCTPIRDFGLQRAKAALAQQQQWQSELAGADMHWAGREALPAGCPHGQRAGALVIILVIMHSLMGRSCHVRMSTNAILPCPVPKLSRCSLSITDRTPCSSRQPASQSACLGSPGCFTRPTALGPMKPAARQPAKKRLVGFGSEFEGKLPSGTDRQHSQTASACCLGIPSPFQQLVWPMRPSPPFLP